MRNMIAFVSLIGLLSLGCQAPVANPVALLNENTAFTPLSVGREYAITMKTNSNKQLTYEGKVKGVEGDTIVQESPMLIARREQAPPILGHIPVLKHQFTNVSVGRDKSEQDVTVNRHDILNATPIEKSTNIAEQPDAGEASAQPGLKQDSTSRFP